MSDLEKIIENNDKKNTKLKAFIAGLVFTITTVLSHWEATAQTNMSKDQILHNIELILKSQWWEYESLLWQRDALLKSYKTNGGDVMDDFITTQKGDFEKSYKNNEYGMQNKVKNIGLILSNDFWINVNGKTPVQILSIALQILSNEDSMSWLKPYASKLSGEFDINFVNAYWYIQSKYPNTWISVNGTLMPNWELDWVVWNRTIDIIIDVFNNWSFTAHFDVPDFVPTQRPSSTTTVAPTWNIQESRPEPQKPSQNASQWVIHVEQSWNSDVINLDDADEDDQPTWWSNPSKRNTNQNVNQNNNLQSNPQSTTQSNPQNTTQNVSEPTPSTQTSIIDLDDYSLRDTIADIVDNMSWTLRDLEKYLSQNNLVNISHADVLSTVNSIKNDNLKKHVMYYLLKNDVVSAQKLLWMEIDCDSAYPDYIATKKLDRSQLQKMRKLWQIRRYDSPETVLNNPNIPQDVKNVYNQILDGKIKTDNLPYSIVSKTDYRIYLFSADNHLLDRQNTILWADAGDQKNNPSRWVQTTPGGEYRVDSKWKQYMWKDFFINYGTHYIVLRPMNNQYDMTEKYTMWIHWDYKKDRKRKTDLYSSSSQDHRSSNGCINVDSDLFWEIYNHLPRWSVLYVTYE